jgi:plasmid stabilization system protein ParE
MNYKIHVSHAAEHDLHSAANYIAHQLQNPLAARRMLANALASIDSLETFPGRFPVIDEPLLASHQLHFGKVRFPIRELFASVSTRFVPYFYFVKRGTSA